MKRYMPEMTNLQVREYMDGGGRTVLVPVVAGAFSGP